MTPNVTPQTSAELTAQAKQEMAGLVEKAAAGQAVTHDEAMSVLQKTHVAAATTAVSQAVAAHQKRKAELAEIADRAAQAVDLTDAKKAASIAYLAAARVVDAALADLQMALEKLDAAAEAVGAADRAMHDHNFSLHDIARRNSELAKTPMSEWPKTRPPAHTALSYYSGLQAALIRRKSGFRPEINGPHEEVVRQSAVQFVAGIVNLPADAE